MQLNDISYTPHLADEKIRIAFLFQIPSFWPSWESVYNTCINDSRFDVKLMWLFQKSLYKTDFQMRTAEQFLSASDLKYEPFDKHNFIAYAPHVAVIQSPYDTADRPIDTLSMWFRGHGARIVYIPYGIEISDQMHSRILHFKLFTTSNAWRIYTFSEAIRADYVMYCPNRSAVRAPGHPKFDGYTDKSRFALPEKVQREAAGRKILLWKMHFPFIWQVDDGRDVQITPSLDEYVKFAEWIANCTDLYFVFRPHPYMVGGGANEIHKPQLARLMAILESTENVYIDYSDDYRNALLNADAIIIDRSALMVEAGITGVPILYMYNKDNTEKLTDAIVPLIQSYYQGTTAEDMVRFVEMFKLGKDPNKEQREKAFRECIPHTDGKCGIRIADDIANSLIAERLPHVPKIAIFGIGMLFQRYCETTLFMQNGNIELVCFSDNNSALWGTDFCKIPIVEPVKLCEYDFDAVVIFSETYYWDIYKQLAFELDIDMDKILRLDKFLLWLSSLEGELT